MWVVKFGGSLLSSPYLHDWLSIIQEQGKGKIVVVPGGSIFADQVRTLQSHLKFDDITAHEMALHAMEQYGLLLKSMGSGLIPATSINEINKLLSLNKIPLWFPCKMLSGNTTVPANWDVTSDSLALWLTEQLVFRRLLLIKSTVPKENVYVANYLSQAGYLDKAFATMFNSSLVRSVWISHEQLELFNLIINKDSIANSSQNY